MLFVDLYFDEDVTVRIPGQGGRDSEIDPVTFGWGRWCLSPSSVPVVPKEWNQVFPNAACTTRLARLLHHADATVIEGNRYRVLRGTISLD